MEKVVVTGSAGFIGGYLVEELLRQGYAVTGVDNFSKYGKVARSYDDHPGYRAVVAQRMLSDGPDAVRNRVRDWLSELLNAEGAGLILGDPVDWTDWDDHRRR